MSSVTVKGIQESHTDTQDPLMGRLDLNMASQDPQLERDRELFMAKLDLNMESQDPQVKGDWELLTDSQETPHSPHSPRPIQLEDRDLVTVSSDSERHSEVSETLRIRSWAGWTSTWTVRIHS